MTGIVDPFAEGYKAPAGGIVDPFAPDYQPPKPRGMISAFGAGVQETAGEAAQAVGAKTGLKGVETWGQQQRTKAAPNEEESLPVSAARALGGLTGWLPAIAGTAAVLPEVATTGLAGAALTAARAATSMALPAATAKVTTTADLKDKGVSESEADNAGWAAAATTAAGGVVPLSKVGGFVTRAVSGGASQLAFGEANRELQNKILEDHPELQNEFSAKNALTNAAVGAAMGVILGPRPEKAAIANAETDAETALNNPDELRGLPNPEAPVGSETGLTKPTMLSFADGSVGTQEEFDARINSLPPQQRAAERARLLVRNDQEAKKTEAAPDMSALSAEANRRKAVADANAAAQAGFGKQSEFADFVTQEKADLEQRRQQAQAFVTQEKADLEQRRQQAQATADQWRQTKLASDIESTDARVEGARLQQQTADRQNLMDSIYSDPNERTPGMTFLQALEREYPNKPEPTPQEKAMLAKRESAYQAFAMPEEPLPSAPNEMAPELVPEKKTAPAAGLKGVEGDRARGPNDVANMWKDVLKNNEGAETSIKAQHIAKAVKDKGTITEQLAAIKKLRDKPNTGTDNKALLDQLSAKLAKFKKEPKNAVPIEKPASVDVREQTGNGEGVGEQNTRPEIPAPESKGGNAPGEEPSKISSVKQIRGTGETHVTLSTGETIKIFKDNATGSMGLPGWHWDESHSGNPGPSQKGHITTYLADTKAEAIKELEKKLPNILKLKQEPAANEAKKTEAAQAQPGEAQQPQGAQSHEWGANTFAKVIADAKAEKPAEAITEPKVNPDAVARQAALEKIKTQRDLTPTEHRELVNLKTDNEEARAWEAAKDRGDTLARAGEAFESKTAEQAANPATREQIDTEAAKIFGSKEAADRMIVHVTDPETQIPARALKDLRSMEAKEGRSITVAFAHDGKIYIMDNQIEAGSERAIILHEAGVHLGMEKLIGKVNFDKLVEQIREWSNGNGHLEDIALAQKAMQSVRDHGVPESQMEQETVAYFVQHAIEAGINPTHIEGQVQSGALKWLRKIWSTMKAALQRLGVDPSSLKAKDIVDIAHAAAIAHAEAIPGEHAETTDFRYPQTLRSAKALDFQAGPKQAAQAADAVMSKAMGLWDRLKPALQRTHLNWSQMTHIADMTENLIPMLPQWGKNAVSPIRDKVNNMLASGAIAKELNHKAQGIYDQMQALAPKQKDALVQLMGKYQLAKVYPNLPIEAHTWLKDKTLYREAKQLYAQPGVAAAYDAARLHNQRLHDTGMASMLKSMAQIYSVPENLWRAVDVKNGMSKEVTALLDHIKASDDHDLQDHVSAAMNLHEAKKSESYFSLGRDGDYMVNFHVKDTPEAHAAIQKALDSSGVKDKIVVNPGDTHVFSMFETMNEMLAVTKQLDSVKQHLEPKVGEDFEGKPTSSPYTAGLAVEKLKALDSSAPSFIRGMLAKIDADAHLDKDQKIEQQELLRRMYIGMLPESSVSKFYARRAGTPGYSSDLARSFVKRAAAGAYFTAQHATRPEQNVAMARLREATSALGDAGSGHFDLQKQAEAVNVTNELNKRTANMLTPLHTPMIDTASAIGHAFYLSASPGFVLQNLAQPYQLTLPYLGGRHGFRTTSVAMGKAASDVGKIIKDTIQQGWQNNKWTGVLDATITVDRASHLSASDKDALKHLIASGRADWTQGGELTKIAEGSTRSLETALKTANSMSYYGEVLNRMQTGLAAYRLELKRTGDADKAKDYMVKAVDDTQINYASENKARAIGKHGVFGAVSPLVLAFQQYNLGVLQLLGKLTTQAVQGENRAEAVKSLAGIMAATGVTAGTMGLPFAGLVMGAYNTLMGSEDSPVDAKSDYQNFLSDIMGHDAAQVVAHGALNYVSGADVASRLSQENVIPFTGLAAQLMDPRQKLKDRIDSGALSFMGPVVNGGANVLEGLGKVADGQTMKGLEQMSPAAFKGAIKAVDLSDNGFTSANGVKLPMEATTWDTAVQAAGFTPTKQSTQREAQQAVSSITNALNMRKQDLGAQFAAAVENHDVEARQKVMEEAKAFMLANPGQKVDFAGALKRHAQEAEIARATGTGVKGSVKQLPLITQQARFAVQQ